MRFNFAIFKKTFFENKTKLAGYSFGLALYGLTMTLFYPTLQKNLDNFKLTLEAYPEGFKKAFGISTDSLSTLEGFLSVEYFSMFWILILSILIFSIGASFVAGEKELGTIDFTYTLPLKRKDIVFNKFISGILLAFIAGFSGIAGSLIGAYIIGEQPNLVGFMAFTLIAFTTIFFLLSLTTLLSSIFKNRAKVYTFAAIIFATSYVLQILSSLNKSIEKLYYLSFFKYYGSPENILNTGTVQISYIIVLLVLGIILLGIALHYVEKRDL